ncbi:aquaporin-like protein [Rhodotorula sp. JG-1b]|nr:aquaporin-like protein [Rhodotorula sp. JG-1b]
MSEKVIVPLRQLGSRSLVIKSHLVAALGEFVGTTLFLFFAFAGTHVANSPANSITGQTASGLNGSTVSTVNTSSLLYIAFAFGMSLTATAWCMSRVSGSLYNPAVSLGLLLVGAMSPIRAAILTFMQFLGGLAAAGLVSCMTPGQLNVRTTLAEGMSITRGLFLEAACTALLMLVILLVAAEKHSSNFIAPLPIGLALFVAELASVSFTGGSLNPARSLGPDVVSLTFNGYAWIYFLGPFLGAAVAAGFYRLLKWLELKTTPEPIGSLGKEKETAQLEGEGAQGAEAGTKNKKKAHKVEATGLGGGLISGPENEQGGMVAGGELMNDTREVKARLSRIEDLLSSLTPVRTNYSSDSAKQGFSPGTVGETKPTAEYFDHVSYNRV